MKAFKCPNCAGDIRYDIEKESMSCIHCGSLIKREEYQDYLDSESKYLTTELECPQCGASVLSYDDTLSSFCSYCGASITFTKRLIEIGKPDGIIPFKITKEEALENYKKHIGNIYFAPKWMYEDCEEKTVGIYIPYYEYDGRLTGHFRTTGKEEYTSGSQTVVKEYNVEFDLDARYEGTRFDASKTFPDSMSEGVDTFNIEEIKDFETSYLAGFYSDNGDTDESDYSELTKKLLSTNIKSDFRYSDVKLNMGNVNPDIELKSKKILLPVWLNTHKRGERVFYSAVNGENGDVSTETPIDKFKYLIMALIVGGLISVVMNLIFTIKPGLFLFIAGVILFIFGLCLRKVAGDVYIRENHLDDLGLIGLEKFNANAKSNDKPVMSDSNRKVKWLFNVPAKVRLVGWWRTLIGVLIILGVLISGTNLDYVYYIAAGINIILAIWSAFSLIDQQNKLASRDIPIFTMKRGGDDNG